MNPNPGFPERRMDDLYMGDLSLRANICLRA